LLVASYRSGARQTSPFLRSFDELYDRHSRLTRVDVEVPPLSEDETRELALKLLGPDRHSPEMAALIVRESRGSALFIYELARHVRAGMEMSAGGRIELDEILWARAAKLPEEARILLSRLRLRAFPFASAMPVPPRPSTGRRTPSWRRSARDISSGSLESA
jgi:hypothetical protein